MGVEDQRVALHRNLVVGVVSVDVDVVVGGEESPHVHGGVYGGSEDRGVLHHDLLVGRTRIRTGHRWG